MTETATTQTVEELKVRHLNRIKRAGADADRLSNEFEEAKEIAKGAKARYDAACAKLLTLVRQDPKQREIFDKDGSPPPESEASESNLPDKWQDIGIDQVPGITPKQVELFKDAKLKTLGDLASFSEANQLTDIKGIGKAAATKIDEAMDSFWAANPQYSE